MNADRFELLAQAVIDGAATAEERKELDALVAGDPALRERWTSIDTATRALAGVHPVPAPLDLKPAVMRAVHASRRAGASPPPRLWWLRLGSAFVAGAAAGIVVWSFATGSGGPVANTSGTMAPAGREVLGHASVRAGSVEAVVETHVVTSGIEAEIVIRSPIAGEIELGYPGALHPTTIEAIESTPSTVTYSTDHVTIAFAGNLRLAVRLAGDRAAERPVRVSVRSAEGQQAAEIGPRALP